MPLLFVQLHSLITKYMGETAEPTEGVVAPPVGVASTVDSPPKNKRTSDGAVALFAGVV